MPTTPRAKTALKPSSGPAVKKAPVAAAKKAVPAKTTVKKAAPQKVAKPPKVEKIKQKLVRDSFTMPNSDWDLIQALKDRAMAFKRPAKKSELLRAGLHVLAGLSDAKLQAALNALQPLKLGRPKKDPLKAKGE